MHKLGIIQDNCNITICHYLPFISLIICRGTITWAQRSHGLWLEAWRCRAIHSFLQPHCAFCELPRRPLAGCNLFATISVAVLGNFPFGLGFWGAPFFFVFGTIFGRKKSPFLTPFEVSIQWENEQQCKCTHLATIDLSSLAWGEASIGPPISCWMPTFPTTWAMGQGPI